MACVIFRILIFGQCQIMVEIKFLIKFQGQIFMLVYSDICEYFLINQKTQCTNVYTVIIRVMVLILLFINKPTVS